MKWPIVLAALAMSAVVGLPSPCQAQEAESAEAGEQATFRSLTRQQIEQRLEETTELEFRDLPLADALNVIGAEHQVPVFLDRRALQDIGMDVTTPVSAEFRGASLGTALTLMLREWDLTYVVGEGAVLVTTPEESEQRIEPRVYAVYDLVEVHDWRLPPAAVRSPGRRMGDFDSLISLITTTVHPESWEAVGGPGAIRALAPDLLIVTQTSEVQEEVRDLLAALRRLPPAGEQDPSYGEEGIMHKVGPTLGVGSDAEEYFRIRADLKAPTMIDMVDVPLAEAMQEIGRLHELPVLLDRRSLGDVGIDAGAPVTARYQGIPLRTALEYLLDEYGLTYRVEDEVLLVTTPEEAEREMSLRVYPVIDLVRVRSEEEDWLSMDFDSLINVLLASVHATSWDIVGGPGSLHPFPQRAALVVRQTQRTHEEIEELLAGLRRERKAGSMPDIPMPSSREQVVTRAYQLTFQQGPLSDESQQALRSLIRNTVRPDSWGNVDDQQRFITFLPGMIIIHHRQDVQSEVGDLLLRLGLIVGKGALDGLPGQAGSGQHGGGFFRPANAPPPALRRHP